MTQKTTRREASREILLAAAAGCCWSQSRGLAIEPLQRPNPRIKGLSLSTYSLKPHMRWWWGERAAGELDMLGFLEYCSSLGLEAAELTSYFFELPVQAAYLNRLKRQAYLLGLDISGGAMGNDFGHPPGSDETLRQLDYARQWIDHFADLGAPVVRVFASRRRPAGLTDEEVLANVVDNLTEVLGHAEHRGVLLGLENHDFLENIDYLLEVLRRIDSDWLGVVWDSANLAPTPDPYAQLARIAPYALVAQLKVMTHVNGRPVPADFARLVEILRQAGYGGYLVLEYEEPEDPYAAIPRYLKPLRELVAQEPF